MSVERKKITKSSSSNCRMRSRRLLRIRTEKINTTNFWKGYAGVRTTSAGNSSPQFEKNRQLALARKRSALLRIKSSLNNEKSGDQTSSGVSYSVKRRPLAALPDFLKQALPTKSSSNTKKSSTSKQPTIGGGGVRDVWGSDLRNAAEFASTMSYALGALSTLSTQATAQKAEAARVAFNKEVAASGITAPAAGRVGGCKRRRQSQRKLQEVDKGAQVPPQSLEEGDTNNNNNEYHDPRRSVVGSLSTSLSKYCSSMCHTIAKQIVTGSTSGSTFRSALLNVAGTSSNTTANKASSSATTTSTVLRPSTIASRLASVNALLEAFESISVLQRRVQSRRTKGSINSSGTNTIKPCSRDFTSKAVVYARRKSNKRMSIKDSL